MRVFAVRHPGPRYAAHLADWAAIGDLTTPAPAPATKPPTKPGGRRRITTKTHNTKGGHNT